MSEQKSKQCASKSTMNAAACTTAFSNTVQSRRRITQNYLLIWTDGNIDETNTDCQNTLAQLRSVVNEVTICTEPAQCIKCLNDMDDEKAFVISSGALGQHLVPQIHGMPQLDAIYIFCGNESQHKAWAKEWPKIEGVFTSIKPICESLKKVARQCNHDSITMSFVPKRTVIDAASIEKSLDELPPSYMYSVLFKEIILEIHEDDVKSVDQLVAYCSKQDVAKSQLEYFQREYQHKSVVWWYTEDIFLYGMLNYGLRTLDMEIMSKMGFFIRNLHKQLEQLHKKQSKMYTKKFFVYRGQGLSQQDFQHLRDTQGGLLSFNNFLSTSKKQSAALGFVETKLHKDKEIVGVLFIMTIDSSKISSSSIPFALIDDYSAFPQEQEILFSMHTVFHVAGIKQTVNNNRLWEVQLTLTDDNDPQLSTLTKRMKEEIGGTGWYRMGRLMLKVGHFNQAEELYNELLKNTPSDSDRAHIYHQLGVIKDGQGQYKEAISFYEKYFAINRKTLPEDHPSFTNAYNNIGVAYKNMGDYSKALEFHDKAHKINEKALPPNHPDLTGSYNNIGNAYDSMGDYSKALEFYYKAHKIYEKTLPPNHPDLATSFNNIGATYNNKGDYSKALEFYDKAFKIYEKTLPSNHPLLATSYNNIGNAYDNLGDYSKALEYYDKALKIRDKALPPNHPDLARSYNNIGMAYSGKGDYSKALEFHYKAHKIYEKTLSPNHPDLATSYNNIGNAYDNMGDYSKALEYYDKALKIREKALPPNHPDLATSFNNIGATYHSMSDYSKALEYYDKALKIREKALPPNYPSLALYYSNIGMAYSGKGDYSKALEFHDKALKIREKALPSNHPDLATSYNNIGLAYKKMGDYSKALEFYDKALKIREKTLPSNHPDWARSYNNIGMAYSGKGDYSKALSFLEKALSIWQKSLPSTHPSIQTTMDNIDYVKKKK
ncbi:unnamed protein product [Rotaria sp. Silwood2]|nr:unnamed protein product [Rotaria sp. Silwood2]CAF2941512.1 unnamed protein product [Rotaria sp. Silwood2]CAF4123780.1 unnamed protein product [Rotaria sp. Silwood2]CAF4235057.1 unnamed protein product [Rotaria sp. Silwood2]